jgi:GPH family glycoside/pentoside/hexuronide:cation symporter
MLPQSTAKHRWLYSLINFGNILTMQAFSAYVLFFYVDVRHLPAAWAATVMTLYGIWNAMDNPIMGYLSDRTRSRWGRRIPYIRYAAAPLAIFFFLVWAAPFDGRAQPGALLAYFTLVIFIWEGLLTVLITPYYALLPEMFTTFRERTAVALQMNLMQILALIAGVALPPLIYSRLGWPAMGTLFAALALVTWLVGARGLFERPEYAEASLPLWRALRETFANRAFLTAVIAQTLRFFGTNVLSIGMAFYAKYSLHADESVTSFLFAAVFVTAMPFLFFWRWVSHRLQPRGTLMLAYFLTGVAALGLLVAQKEEIYQAIGVAATLGVGLAGLILMSEVILCDVVDDDELRTGCRREGMYFGMSAFINTFSGSLAALVFGLVTGAYGYDSALTVQPPSVETGFRVFMSIPTCAGMLMAVLSLAFYPLHGERLRRLRAVMAERHG